MDDTTLSTSSLPQSAVDEIPPPPREDVPPPPPDAISPLPPPATMPPPSLPSSSTIATVQSAVLTSPVAWSFDNFVIPSPYDDPFGARPTERYRQAALTQKESKICAMYKAAQAEFETELLYWVEQAIPDLPKVGNIPINRFVELARTLRASRTRGINSDARFAALRSALMVQIEGRWHSATRWGENGKGDPKHRHFFWLMVRVRNILNGQEE